jgi:hypothetical protein
MLWDPSVGGFSADADPEVVDRREVIGAHALADASIGDADRAGGDAGLRADRKLSNARGLAIKWFGGEVNTRHVSRVSIPIRAQRYNNW